MQTKQLIGLIEEAALWIETSKDPALSLCADLRKAIFSVSQPKPVAWIKPDVLATLRGEECCYAFGEQSPKGNLVALYTSAPATNHAQLIALTAGLIRASGIDTGDCQIDADGPDLFACAADATARVLQLEQRKASPAIEEALIRLVAIEQNAAQSEKWEQLLQAVRT